MRPRVYVETTIPNSYHESRTTPEAIARRDLTRQWWEIAPGRYVLFTSEAVINELEAGRSEHTAARVALLRDLTLLPIKRRVAEIVQAYIRHKLMPANPGGDALHLALASYHECEFLVTWNCHHLANANKFGHIRRINATLGLSVPRLVTPLELLGGSDD